MSTTKTISISSSTIFKVVFIILAIIFLYLVRDVIAIFIFALIIASAIAPVVNLLERIKIPRVIGALIIYIIVIGFIGLVLSLIIPGLSRDVGDLSSNLPAYIEDLSEKFESFKKASTKYGGIIDKAQNYLTGAGDLLKKATSNLFSTAVSIFGGIFSFLTALIVSFYLSVQKKGIKNALASIIPHQHKDYILGLWERSQRKLGRWLQGQLFLGLVVGTMSYIGLTLLNVKFALVLAILAGTFELLPYIGPIMSGIPAVILAFLQAPILGFWVLILYIVIQQLENNLIVPLVVGKIVKLSPVIIILALLIGAKLGGIVGMFLAVPITAVVAEFFRDIVKKRK
ncbi:MAG: AI-2E family transporter [Patescibacteria group bacterium]